MQHLRAFHVAAAAVLLLAGAAGADAQITRVSSEGRNLFGFNLGYFAVRGEDARGTGTDDDDVLLADLPSLLFDVRDFNGLNVGGEFVFGLSEHLEAGVGVNFYQKTVPSVYRDVVSDDGLEIEQDLKLRIIPVTATIRFLPIGRGGVEPYVGAGVGVFNWRYSEVGEFVDFDDYSIFRDRYIANGTATGPVVLGGIRFPVSDIWSAGGEVRYQKAKGKDLRDQGFLGDTIDLGGWTTSFTFHLRF